ncbi:hypothetical protein ACFE04_007155 [Oxalis oulophora]
MEPYSLITDIIPGRLDWWVKVSVIRKWILPDYFNPHEIKSLEIILLDQKSDKIHCSIRKELIPLFQDKIEEGLIVYSIRNLSIASVSYELLDNEESYSQTISTTTVQSTVNDVDDFLQSDKKTLNDFFEVTQDYCVSVMTRIDSIDISKKWSYESCAKCFSKVERNGPKFLYEKCEEFVYAIPR